MQIPQDLRYSKDHEWVKDEGSNKLRLGITDYAQDALGDVVFVDIPEIGSECKAGDAVSEVESTKSVSDIYSPVDGVVVSVNDDLNDAPEKINSDPYGDGWICEIEMSESSQLSEMLDADAYKTLTEG